MNRRDFFKLAGGAAALATQAIRPMRLLADGGEPMPVSPQILDPFRDELPIPQPLAPVDPRSFRVPVDPSKHQLWCGQLGLPDPVCYKIDLLVRPHSFTSSPVRTLAEYRDQRGNRIPAGTTVPRLPDTTIYGFNGTFPGPMIRARYGQPALVRFENRLHENPYNLDRGDFGAPDWSFLTHLHNGHTACESDGNPHDHPEPYRPGEYCDNLYLNWPAGGDDREKQSFFWFHDHRMDHTGANVYKGMVGLYPIYDERDCGDETRGFRLPSFQFDIPLAFYDCAIDDGATEHIDFHHGNTGPHPENWGKTFFAHYPNGGFVGDIFTVNGKAYPVLRVQRRKYRLRFLDASIARCYQLKLMRGSVTPAPGTQGQFQLSGAQQCMRYNMIAVDGGLLPRPVVRDYVEIWPAKRREAIVDFSKYQDGSPTRKGDVIYMTDVMKMSSGRKPDSLTPDGSYNVPVLKIIIESDPVTPDYSLIPATLRAIPPVPTSFAGLTRHTFELVRSSFGGELQWGIKCDNGPSMPFDPSINLVDVPCGSEQLWTIENGGGGWTHPFHLHMEEHHVVERNGKPSTDALDNSKEDVVALAPGESVTIYRKFRTFRGKYVAHCHNLAHEDHAMMFGWSIV